MKTEELWLVPAEPESISNSQDRTTPRCRGLCSLTDYNKSLACRTSFRPWRMLWIARGSLGETRACPVNPTMTSTKGVSGITSIYATGESYKVLFMFELKKTKIVTREEWETYPESYLRFKWSRLRGYCMTLRRFDPCASSPKVWTSCLHGEVQNLEVFIGDTVF